MPHCKRAKSFLKKRKITITRQHGASTVQRMNVSLSKNKSLTGIGAANISKLLDKNSMASSTTVSDSLPCLPCLPHTNTPATSVCITQPTSLGKFTDKYAPICHVCCAKSAFEESAVFLVFA